VNESTNPVSEAWQGATAAQAGQAPDAARCAVHPDVAARVLCERCGSYACDACTVWRPDGALCAPCSRRAPLGLHGSWLAIGAAVLSFIGLGCAPFGPAAMVLAAVDLVRIQMGAAPKGGWKLDALGLALGLVGTLIWIYVAYTWATEPDPLGDPYYGDPYGY